MEKLFILKARASIKSCKHKTTRGMLKKQLWIYQLPPSPPLPHIPADKLLLRTSSSSSILCSSWKSMSSPCHLSFQSIWTAVLHFYASPWRALSLHKEVTHSPPTCQQSQLRKISVLDWAGKVGPQQLGFVCYYTQSKARRFIRIQPCLTEKKKSL